MDAVGNILAERQKDRAPLGVGVSLAFLLHATIAAGFLLSALARPVRFAVPRAVSVRLMPAAALPGGAAVAVPAPQAPEPEPVKPKIEKAVEPPPPPTSKAVLLPSKKKEPEPPPAVSRAAEAKKPEPARAAPAGPGRGTSPGATINASGAGVGIGSARLDQPDFQYAYYIERMIIAVGTNWFKPAQSVPVEPVVRFRVERDGTVSDPEIEVSSGLPFVDRAALRAVLASSPLPPLPPEYAGTSLGVHLIFEK